MADGATQDELEEWAERLATVNFNVTRGATEGDLAGKAAPLIWSEFGEPGWPRAGYTMVMQALEAGYAQALSDIQDGDLDGQIAVWRPELTED
jgi:hypothetical protein